MTVRAFPWVDFGGVTVSGNDVLRQNALKLAHAYLNANVGKGDTVIKTQLRAKAEIRCCLRRLSAKTAKVIAIDIQKEAIDEAEKLIAEHGVSTE